MTYDQITANIAIVERQLDSVIYILRAMREFADDAASISRAIKAYEDMETRLGGTLQDLHLERDALEKERIAVMDADICRTLGQKFF